MKLHCILAIAGAIGVSAAQPLPLIPKPVSVTPGQGSFAFSAETGIRHNRELSSEAKLLAADLERLTGSPPKLVSKEMRIMLPSEILLDLDPAHLASRLTGAPDRLERAGSEFHRRTRAAFLDLARAEPQRWQVLDASQDPDVIAGQIRELVAARVGVTP